MNNTVSISEIHVALIGMKNSGKSAIAVKYMTKRFLGEYCSNLEDTYCRQETIGQNPVMIWLMDTVDSAERDPMRYLAWADVFVVIYDVTSRLSFQIAEQLLQQIAGHEHSICERDHKTLLLGNKTDLDRYRQVNESDGEKLAKKYSVLFSEVSATEPQQRIQHVLQKPISTLMKERARSPSPRLYSSDSEVQARQRKGFSFRNVARSGTLRRSKSPKQMDTPKIQKNKSGSKTGLFKLFHT